jgi:hypothetical protein
MVRSAARSGRASDIQPNVIAIAIRAAAATSEPIRDEEVARGNVVVMRPNV